MPQVLEITVFAINELSERARGRAHKDWLNGFEYSWAAENKNKDSLYKFAEIAEIKIMNFEYGGYSHAFCDWSPKFDNYQYEDEILNLSGARLVSWLYNHILNYTGKGKYYSTDGTYDAAGKHHYKHRSSKCTKEYDNCPLTGYCMDNSLIIPILNYVRKTGEYKAKTLKQWEAVTLEDIINDCCSTWAKDCNNDAEHQASMEAFIEACEANNYIFTSAGRMENI